MRTDIRAEIAAGRVKDMAVQGAAQGLELPSERCLPVAPFPEAPGVICEVKRKSPSVADIDSGLDPVELARHYFDSGIRNISVLTEQNYFGGSLADLVRIKNALPAMAVLRKDFLITEEDIKVSYMAGADACLLIASLLGPDRLQSMYELCIGMGMTPLVELHSSEDVKKASIFRPALVGINSRDLRTFKIKPLRPLEIRAMVDWDCRIVYESGIKTDYDIDFVRASGFDAALAGEAAVRDTAFAAKLAAAFTAAPSAPERFAFWKKLYGRCRPDGPLVKICGITNHADLEKVVALGADVAGFILADSPRRVGPAFVESCRDFDILKVGVVVLEAGQGLPDEVAALLGSGALDAVQFHGNEQPAEYLKWPGYKAVGLRAGAALEQALTLPGPAVLIDAFSATARGGTGRRIAPELVEKVSAQRSLWLAGGITPENVSSIITEFSPDLIDVSSGVEVSPGKKDHDRMELLFSEADRALKKSGEMNEQI